jgi:hypothetical protein
LVFTGCRLSGFEQLTPQSVLNPDDSAWLVRYCWEIGDRTVSKCLDDAGSPSKWRRSDVPEILVKW